MRQAEHIAIPPSTLKEREGIGFGFVFCSKDANKDIDFVTQFLSAKFMQ